LAATSPSDSTPDRVVQEENDVTIDERHRIALHEAAKETWGPEVAVTLMEMLSATGWADVATKSDLAALEVRLTSRIESGEQRLQIELARSQLRMQRWMVATMLACSAGIVAAVGLLR
jgi:hypothetical protein